MVGGGKLGHAAATLGDPSLVTKPSFWLMQQGPAFAASLLVNDPASAYNAEDQLDNCQKQKDSPVSRCCEMLRGKNLT